MKEETYPPTAFIDSIFITSIIDAIEERDVAYVYIPGAFLQTDKSNGAIIKIKEATVDALLRIN